MLYKFQKHHITWRASPFILDNGEAEMDIVFICKYQSGEPKPIPDDEVSEVYWLSSNKILENKIAPI